MMRACLQSFLNELSKEFHNDIIVLVCDGASWHKAEKLMVPDHIAILFISPYMPEMKPIEQIWKELRANGFCNEVFVSLEKVVDRLCETINHLTNETIISITRRNWI